MGDDDVICLSSDDEFAPKELPRKKPNTNNALSTAKVESKESGKGTIVSSLKRRTSEVVDVPNGKSFKRTKSMNNDIEEVRARINAAKEASKSCNTVREGSKPRYAAREEIKSRTAARDESSKLATVDQSDLIGNRPLSIKKVTVRKSLELLESSDKPKSSHSNATTATARSDVQKLHSTSDVSKQSNGRIADSSKSCNSQSTTESSDIMVVNPVAILKNRENSRSPCFTTSKMVHKIVEKVLSDDAKNTNGATSRVKLHIELPKAVSLTIAAHENANGTRSRAATSTISAKSSKIVGTVENAKFGTAAIATKSGPDRDNTPANKLADSRAIRETSPEILIISAVDKTENKAKFSNSSNGASKSEGNINRSNENSCSSTPKNSKEIQLPCVTSSTMLSNRAKDTLNKMGDCISRIRSAKGDSSILPTRDSDTSKSSLKLQSRGPNTQQKDDRTAVNRITPYRLSESPSTPNRSKPDVEKSPRSLKNSTLHSSKESDRKIANGVETIVSNDSKDSGSMTKSKSNDYESKPSCSKSPDEKIPSSVVSSLKRKLSSETEERAKKRSAESSKSVDFEPQPGCSKSPDNVIQKPRLVVVDKKPISHESEDTFSMFISLCLQTDRCSDMEKVVAKLKRYYEQLNPAYANSQAFRNTLNEKRELITQKGKKVVYHYVALLKEDMKAKKRMSISAMKAGNSENAADGLEDAANEYEEEEDSDEARRKRQKIKRIEKAMKECQKIIKKYEEAEIDFEDENNSHYIKLERFKERMVELYTQMCKYTHEHPDAGRAYLRPKHLRVTQIPSVDQAINSFINSKLSFNKRKDAKGKTFVDGLIFPDYVDILECVEKANEEQELKLNKRAMQNMAEKAFTQLGKHLQEARQNDYWDTFSLHLENNIDPATSDCDLSEKLARNKIIAEENEKKIFEEYVRKQEERKAEDKDNSDSEGEDEEDVSEEEEEEEKEDNDKISDHGDESNMEMSTDEDSDQESEREDKKSELGDKKDTVNAIEIILNASEYEDTVQDDAKDISKSNNVEASEPTVDKRIESVASSSEDSAGKAATTIEVTLDDVDTKDGEKEPVQDEKLQQLLRIRSFAKPPDSWQCSQEVNEEASMGNEKEPQTLDNTEEDIAVVSYFPEREKIVKNLINDGKTIVGVRPSTVTKNTTTSPTAHRRLCIAQALNAVSAAANSTNDQNTRYLTIAPGIKVPVQIIPKRLRNNFQTTKTATIPQPPEISVTSARPEIRIAPIASSTPIQHPQSSFVRVLSSMPRVIQQPTQQVQALRLGNEKYVGTTFASRVPNVPRVPTVAATSTPIRLSQMQPQAQFTSVQDILSMPVIKRQIRDTALRNLNILSNASTPIRPNNLHENRVLTPVTPKRCSPLQVLRLSNGIYVNRPTCSSENLEIFHEQRAERNIAQQQQKVTNSVPAAVVSVRGASVVGQTTSPVLKQRMNDNVQTIPQQRTNVVRVTRPGDQNHQASDSGPKRKNEPS